MVVDMVCACGAAIQIEIDEENFSAWLLIQRFTDAHVSCGYMTSPVLQELQNPKSSFIDIKDAE
jgi:hypothetical protein